MRNRLKSLAIGLLISMMISPMTLMPSSPVAALATGPAPLPTSPAITPGNAAHLKVIGSWKAFQGGGLPIRLALNSDGTLLTAAIVGVVGTTNKSLTGEIAEWSLSDGILSRRISLASPVDSLVNYGVAFSPNRKFLASGGLVDPSLHLNTGKIHLWDTESGKMLPQSFADKSADMYTFVRSVAFSPDSKTLASGELDGEVYLWDIATGKLLKSIGAGFYGDGRIDALAFSPDGRNLAIAGCSIVGGADLLISPCNASGKTVLFDVSSGEELAEFTNPATGVYDDAHSLAFSHDNKILAVGGCKYQAHIGALDFDCNNGQIWVWSIPRKALIGKPLVGNFQQVTGMIFSPDDKILAADACAARGDCIQGEIHLWDVASQIQLGTVLTVGKSSSVDYVFSSDGTRLITADSDNMIRIWGIPNTP